MLRPEESGIDFRNTLSEQPTAHRNILLYEYFSNGGGVAVGDLNGDGLDDLYFTANMSYNRLYLNRGNLVFDDVTEAAGVAGRRNTWKTGVTMADVNGDGLLDLYVCYSGNLPLDRRIDELYINQGAGPDGVPTFVEQADEFGLANPHSSNQAYFFDYDRDGDLDLFLLTHNVEQTPRRDREGTQAEMAKDDPINGVRLYENRDGHFEDVTRQSGLQSSSLTYGLGAGVSDVDKDGWMDLYVGNDYAPPDYLYINNGDGTFTDQLGSRIGHTSNASMGVDVADINNDGWPDIVVLDMLAEDHRRQKTLFIPDDRSLFDLFVESGFHYQYMRNTLQLNNGDGSFSEIGQLSGISNTDWSWTPLLADFDNDGMKDLFVSNGILHDIIHRDFLVYKNNYVAQRNSNLTIDDIAHLMSMLPAADLKNYLFKNVDGIQFRDNSQVWGFEAPLRTAGAAYSDLDNDGDLDLITNNIDEYAYVFENVSDQDASNRYLQIRLAGEAPNTVGVGSRITVFTDGEAQYFEQMPARGYLSSVSPTLHVGLGGYDRVDSLRVLWPDGRRQTVREVDANQVLTLHQKDAVEQAAEARSQAAIFQQVTPPISFTHQISPDVDDFRRQPLLVNPKSFQGPALATSDVNGDGLDDVFVGGAAGQASMLYVQDANGRFVASSQDAFEEDVDSDDVDALFFDYNRDGHPDLYVASGGYGSFAPDDPALQDRLYVNDGSGSFSKAEGALPEMRTSTGVVAEGDINGDGWPDLFVGAYVVPGRFPEPPRSYVLINDTQGGFEDRTNDVAPAFRQIGMISDAVWHDLNDDGTEDLIVVGAWMPISVFENDEGVLQDRTEAYFEKPFSGLWNTVVVEDVNRDGRPDLIAGNFGLNSQLKVRADQPAELYYADFDHDGDVDPILNYYIQGVSYPYVTLDELRERMPRIGFRFSSYESYADARMENIFTEQELARANKLAVDHLETTLFVGTESGRFERRDLPVQAQFAPVFTISTLDYDGDGLLDLLLGGNINDAPIRIGRHDANYGILLRGNGDATFEYIPQVESGLSLRGDVRGAVRIDDTFLFATNGRPVQAYRLNQVWAGQPNHPSAGRLNHP